MGDSKRGKFMKDMLEMNMNKVVQFLGKPAEEFTKQDIIRFIEESYSI